jgi:hypothetical protein
VSALFFLSLERQREKTSGHWRRDRTELEGGWQGVSESAVRDKPLLVYGLARNRRSPKGPSEPRPSGVHPERGEVEKEAEPPKKGEARREMQQQFTGKAFRALLMPHKKELL